MKEENGRINGWSIKGLFWLSYIVASFISVKLILFMTSSMPSVDDIKKNVPVKITIERK